MCRWNAYFGQPVLIDELLFRTQHSLIDQSLHSRMGVETTNGDGFGVGWYRDGNDGSPARYRSVTPAWSDANLRDLASDVESPLFLAHIRATTGTPVQQTNCHPFRHGRWLFVHNGVIAGFQDMRRDLLYAVDPSLFDGIAGSTDSEALFYLALTFGLEEDPLDAVEQAVGFVEATGRAHGIENPVQMTLGFSDGERLYAVRYSSERRSRTLFVSEDVESVRALYPDNARFQGMTAEDRVVVSEPVSDLPGVWREVPESTALIIQRGPDEQREFHPRVPSDARCSGTAVRGPGRRADGATGPREVRGERADEHRKGACRIALVDAGERALTLIARVVSQPGGRGQLRLAAELHGVRRAGGEEIVEELARGAAPVTLGVDEVRPHAVARREEAVLVEDLGMRRERCRDIALGRLQPYHALHERGQRGVVLGARLGVQDAYLDRAQLGLQPHVPPQKRRLGERRAPQQHVDRVHVLRVAREGARDADPWEGAEDGRAG